MNLTRIGIALLAATAVACSSYANPGEDAETDDPTYTTPGGNSGDDDAQPPGYSSPEARTAETDTASAR